MSGELQSVVIVTPDVVAPADHDAKMIALVDSKSAAAITRPEWLPEKFATVEDMAASYKELEAKQSGAKPAEAAPAVVPVVPPVVAPKDALAITPPDAAATAVSAAGLDMAALNAEFAQSGALSEASMAALAAKGFDKATVDGYVAGQQALASAFQAEVKSATPGGADKYGEMVEWAKVNLSEAEITAYNSAMNTSDKEQAKLLVAGLGAKFSAAVGNEPTLQGGRPSGSPGDVFESIAQMKSAMSDPKYKTDPAYRRSVAEKLGRSDIM